MKFRPFKLREDITDGEYMAFRANIESLRPEGWKSIEEVPGDVLYGILIRSAVKAGWLEVVKEKNEYDEDVEWEWSIDFLDSIPAGTMPRADWGGPILERWIEYRTVDPN